MDSCIDTAMTFVQKIKLKVSSLNAQSCYQLMLVFTTVKASQTNDQCKANQGLEMIPTRTVHLYLCKQTLWIHLVDYTAFKKALLI